MSWLPIAACLRPSWRRDFATSIPALAIAAPTKNLARHARSAHERVFQARISHQRGFERPVMVNRQALNTLANFSGVGARLIFALGFNVIYFRLLGSESYGLIGFYASLAALSSMFDLGLNQNTHLQGG